MSFGRGMRCGAALALLLAISTFAISRSSNAQSVVKLRGNHPRDIAGLKAARANGAAPMKITISLALRDRSALEELIAAQQNPASPEYHRWLTPDEFNRRFGPTPAQIKSVAAWVRGQGLSVDSVDTRARTIVASGSVAVVESAFATEIV